MPNLHFYMASQQDLDFTYSTIDRVFRLSIGETGDYSGAMYNGDFSLTLEEAQQQKYKFIADSLRVNAGSFVLDIGCGWGSFLTYVKHHRGAIGQGITPSQGQAEACRKNGLNVDVKDSRSITQADYGTFDAITCLDGMEHFCSVEQWQAGEQDAVYADFFENLSTLLPAGGRFYMQTMAFGPQLPPFDTIRLDADADSDAYYMALMVAQFSGSWLPYGPAHVNRCASPYFKLISVSSGRLDYIETIDQWRKRFQAFNARKYAIYASLLPRLLTNPALRRLVNALRKSPDRVCFERNIVDHYRFVFEKT